MRTLPFLILALGTAALAQDPSASPGQSKFNPELLGGTKPVLTDQEQASVDITNAWKDKSLQSMAGKAGVNPSPEFRFGESYPSIVCAILQVTDIELQPGEALGSVNVGDSTRWSIESAKSGSGADQVEHLIIKPRDIGVSTSLVVTTDRRTYHLLLVSTEGEFNHYVTFLYGPDSPMAAASSTPSQSPAPSDPRVVAAKPQAQRLSHVDGKTTVSFVARKQVDDADESYAIKGKADWRPVSVYTKDGKTYIEMPAAVRHKEAPVLFEESKSGWFHHSKDLVNYRVHGKWYVVDKVLDKATLVSGVGAAQEKVTISHIDLPAKVEGSANVQ